MEKKEKKPLFFKALTISLMILLLEVGFFIYSSRDYFSGGITGNVIKSSLSDFFKKTGDYSKIFFVAQWLIIIFILITTKIFDNKLNKSTNSIVYVPNLKQETELDYLYEILKKKKRLFLKTISKSFDIKKETAMEWCKILEENNLAKIEYTLFGDPVVIYNEENEETKPIVKVTDKKVNKEVTKDKEAKSNKKKKKPFSFLKRIFKKKK